MKFKNLIKEKLVDEKKDELATQNTELRDIEQEEISGGVPMNVVMVE